MVRSAVNPGGSPQWCRCPAAPPVPTGSWLGSTRDKDTAITGTAIPANVPTPANANDRLWYRVTSDGTTVTVKGLIDNGGPPNDAAWSGNLEVAPLDNLFGDNRN